MPLCLWPMSTIAVRIELSRQGLPLVANHVGEAQRPAQALGHLARETQDFETGISRVNRRDDRPIAELRSFEVWRNDERWYRELTQ